MRPMYADVSAAGASPWVRVNYLAKFFGIGCFYLPAPGAVLTCKVQHSPDTPSEFHPLISLVRAGTVATVVDTDHGLSVGDCAIIQGSGSSNLDGERAVASVVDANSYTYTVANSGALTSYPGVRATNLRVFDHATMTAMTTRTDGNYAFPPQLIRLFCTAFTGGKARLELLQAGQ